ncbi:hypothetical protein G3569_16045 [Aliifodinibius halophilus]|uniref:ATP synthase subunit b n=1 Tax=Fodinibius halophilus TaxID=1736908 RepID=A0A6M1TCY1_9BACT|nr:hypothetical protein [Fodinibius halophilus]
MVAQIVNFLILLALLKRFLFGPIQDIMTKREEQVASRLNEARKKLAEAEAKKKNYQHKLDELERSKKEMLQDAKEQAAQTQKQLEHEAREEIEKMQHNWKEALASEKEAFFKELHRQATFNIINILKKLVQELSNSTLEKETVNVFIEKLQSLGKEEQQKITTAVSGGEAQTVSVISSFELNNEMQQQITGSIKRLFLDDFKCIFEVSSSIGFGIELSTDGWKIGWDANIYLEDLKRNIEQLFTSDVETIQQQTTQNE